MKRVHWSCLLSGVAILTLGCGDDAASGAATAATDPLESFVEFDDVRLHYIDWGGEGDLLLFVPGLSATAHAWAGIAPDFTDTHHVVSVTRRLHGESSKGDTDFDLETLADDLAAVIDALTDQPAVVVGWSYAGLEMPRLARRHPSKVKGLVFVDALFDNSQPGPEVPAPAGFPMPDSVFSSVAAAVDHVAELLPSAQPDLLRQYIGGGLHEAEDGLVRWHLPLGGAAMVHFLGLVGQWSPSDYEGISVPVLAIQVSQGESLARDLQARGFPPDSVEATRRWAREYDDVAKANAVRSLVGAVPGAEVIVLDDVSHNVPVERPSVIVTLLRDFLSGG